MKNPIEKITFSTADLGQAAFLMANGYRFLGAHRTGVDRVSFAFQGDQQTSAAAALEYANGGTVGAKALVEALRFFKSVLRDFRTSNNKVESSTYIHGKAIQENT